MIQNEYQMYASQLISFMMKYCVRSCCTKYHGLGLILEGLIFQIELQRWSYTVRNNKKTSTRFLVRYENKNRSLKITNINNFCTTVSKLIWIS